MHDAEVPIGPLEWRSCGLGGRDGGRNGHRGGTCVGFPVIGSNDDNVKGDGDREGTAGVILLGMIIILVLECSGMLGR